MEAVLRAALVLMSVLPEVERAWGQRAPCYECEVYKDSHPQSKPYEEIRSHCSYPCECGDRTEEPVCAPGVSVVRDGCGCCAMCARQQGETCDGTTLCDEKRGLVCQYPRRGAAKGVCQAIKGLPCTVYNRTYENGETFLLDCRTQCACQNGTYACASLCPQEYISPQGSCRHPRLVEVPGQCCREWMCDSASAQHPPDCRQEYSQWSPCSSPCGLGLSHRVSNLNPQCRPANESRLCQVRTCSQQQLQRHHLHHVRKGHECKATQRVSGPVRLRFGPCRSRKRFRPKSCGACSCCTPQLSTTVKVEFRCAVTASNHEDERDLLLDLVEPGADLWWPDNISPPEQLTTTALPPPPPPPPLRRYAYQVHRGGGVGRPTWRRRMAFRPMEEEEETQEEEEKEDKDEDDEEESRYRTIFFSVQWILKCHCSENCGEIATARPTNGDGEVILHRVHRTAAP